MPKQNQSTPETTSQHASITLYEDPAPGIRYVSGLTICDEALLDSRWVARSWSASGFVEPERCIRDVGTWGQIPLAAFRLEMDGQSLHFGWQLVNRAEAKPPRIGLRHATITLRHSIRPVQVVLHTEVDGTGFMRRWLEITNTGKQPAALHAVAPWAGLLARVQGWRELLPGRDGTVFALGYFGEQIWGNEGAFVWQPLPATPTRIESRQGKSGHGAPFFVVRNEATGEHIVGGIEWSGNWQAEFGCDMDQGAGDALLWFNAGPTAPAPLRVLAPGETVTSPAVHLGVLHTGMDAAIQAWHAHLRQSVLCEQRKGREYLVVCNHWSYWEHEMTEERLRFEIDVAVDIGAELFIIDAGWFGNKGTQWWQTVGDWTCGDRLPNGLEPVLAYARKKGLLYGLWVDAERIGAESRVIKEHPEWLVQRYGKPTGGGDLDLTNPEAAAWLEAQLVRLIQHYDLDLFRLDYNTNPCEGGQVLRHGFMENTQWRHYEAAYRIYDNLRARFPRLILENCAGGGGRTDLGMARRFHHTWISDWQLAPRSVRILNGMTMALPPERVDRNAGVGQDGHRRGDLDFQVRVTLLGHCTLTGIYPNTAERNPAHVDRIRHHVDLYKTFIRPLLPTCRAYHHTPVLPGREPHGWCALEYGAADRSRAVVGVFRLAGPAEPSYRLHFRGLDPNRQYRVTFDNTGHCIVASGHALQDQGLLIRLDHALTSELLLVEDAKTVRVKKT